MSFNSVQEVKEYINNKVKEHLSDKDVTVKYSNRMSRALGRCSYNRITGRYILTFNSKFINEYYNKDNHVKNTVLHEIAHVLAGPGNHHNYIWKRACLSIGGNGERLHKGIEHKVKRDIVYKCTKCGKLYHRARHFDTSRYFCKCWGKLELVS